jgi:serine/threonine protein kinase
MVSQTDGDKVREGEILAGKYRIERVLGQGGMGVVVAARHLELDEWVAIKFLLPSTLAIPEVVARFAQEARAAVKIKSEHVARIIDVGKLETGAPYMVMEYLEGEDLAAWLEARGRLPVEQAALFVLQACEAVAAAHSIGIVHRDLKPSNLFVIRLTDGTLSVKVLDFGISKLTGGNRTDVSITSTATLLGSPLYMPPEQMRMARDVDGRSDIWALGAVLHELVAGVPPFSGTTLGEVMAQVLESAPRSLRASLPEAPAALEAVIAKCLEKQRERRYANIAELANALLPFAPPRGRLSVERIQGMLRTTWGDTTELSSGWPPGRERAPAGATRASWGGTHSRPRGSPTRERAVVIAGAALAVLVALWWFVLGRPSVAPEKQGGPVASGLTVPITPVSPSGVAASEKRSAEPISSVAITPLSPLPSVPAVSEPASPRRKGRVANPRAVPKPLAPSAKVDAAPPPAPSPPLTGGTFEDRK